MKQNQRKVDLGIVYSMYGGVGYPYAYYIDTETSKELFRLMKCAFRMFCGFIKKPFIFIVSRIPILQNLL
jgi:hypothetical protein